MIKRFFNSQTKTVTFAAGLLSISALASRFLGLVRDGLIWIFLYNETMKEKAFTLIELLVVIAIIGVMAGIVLVNLSGSRTKARIKIKPGRWLAIF
jgi:prepilin-type N-terminal cleavage/methylation domain-containing protein